jgi:hypothetical protein
MHRQEPSLEFRPAERALGAFQCSITEEQGLAMCRRAFGAQVQPVSVVELGYGTYNSTYRVDLGTDRPVILRVAPEPSRQSRAERSLMRNEHASAPYLAPIAALMPRTLAIDFTHEIIGRDYLFQTLLDGVPAPDGLAAYHRPEWAPFFRQMGTITRRIHAVRGDSFGWVASPRFARWHDAYTSSLADLAAALADAGLDASDIHETAAAATRQSVIFNEITQPRLLHGDLWTANMMISPGAPEPRRHRRLRLRPGLMGRPGRRLEHLPGRAAAGHRTRRLLGYLRTAASNATCGATRAVLRDPPPGQPPARGAPATCELRGRAG